MDLFLSDARHGISLFELLWRHSTGAVCCILLVFLDHILSRFLYKRLVNVKDRAVSDFPSSLPRICLDEKYTSFQSMHIHSKSLSSFAAPPSGLVGLCSLKLSLLACWEITADGWIYLFFFIFFLADTSDYIAVLNWLWTI